MDYGRIYESRFAVLQKAKDRGWERDQAEVAAFQAENCRWLPDYALYMACKRHFGMRSWTEWEDADIRLRKSPEVLERYRTLLREDVELFTYLQFLFFRQWNRLRDYLHGLDIQVIGDLPIYVAMDSADVWAQPGLFQLDEKNVPTEVSGVPPDCFSEDGQLWGNPLYDWPRHEAEDFRWWKRRIKHATSIYAVVRIDPFRGFESYYSIPAGNKTAAGGHWEKGPDRAFIDAMHKALGEGGIIAEDLGYLTPEVKTMLAASGYPGMKIMQFAFDSREPGNYLPYTYPRNSVVYTGTHDNVTAEGWRQSASAEDVALSLIHI